MQAAKAFHDVKARAHPQVKGVAQNNLRTHFLKAARHHALHGAVGAYGHEDGSLNHTMVECELTSASVAVGVCFEEFKLKHASFYPWLGKGALKN
jgi:hypothetical protein